MGSDATWFHVMITTYGTWLYGDPRGFRTRHHREHVEGVYRNPPPTGTYEAKFRLSQESLKQPPVFLTPEWRVVVGTAVLHLLRQKGIEVIAVAMGRTHGHLQFRVLPADARPRTADAKRHAWFVARDYGWVGHLWGKRSKAVPIRDRAHQENVFHYITRHVREGAWVWTFRDPVPDLPPRPGESPPVATGGL